MEVAPVAAAAVPAPSVNVVDNSVSAAAPQSPAWTESLNPEMKEYVTAKGFKDPGAILESYRNFEKLRGAPQERILKLPETADDAEWNTVYTKLGKPANPDGYGLKVPEGSDGAFTNWAKDSFHKLNLTSEQGQKLVQQFEAFSAAQESEAKEQYTAQIQAQTNVLKKEWGAAYNQNLARAQAAYRTFGLQDNAISALESAIGFDGVMKFMHDLGTKIGEHSFISGDNQNNFGDAMLTPVQAQAKIDALKEDGVFRARYLKGDVKAKEEMEKLHKMANPGA